MSDTSVNNKRIAKNTLLLYVRMLFMMGVSLYTSRVVLNTLGVEDYGIYNVVGGVVAMFGFINGAMSSATQRYLTFELGRGNLSRLHDVFCTSIIIHGIITLLVIFLAETIGLWFFYHKMIIPEDRIEAAMWTYQFSIMATAVMIMSVPYNATIIAHERMSAFAHISVLEVILKLAIAYLLRISNIDKLILYAALIFIVQLGIRMVYSLYCNHHFLETKFHWFWDKKLFREMLGFAGWNLWGNCAGAAFTQGLNILLNIFFGPVVNAARGIAVQVQAAISQFSINFQAALNPQITKSYAVQDFNYMHSLIFRGSKFTFFLLLLLSLPVMMETDTILRLWLGTVPDYTVVFIRLMICITIIDSVANPLMASAAATGKVKLYQGVVGGILLSILPLSYMALKLGGSPATVFIIHLCVGLIAFVVRLYIVRPMIQMAWSDYGMRVVVPCMSVALIASVFPVIMKWFMPGGALAFIMVCLSCLISVSLTIYVIGLSTSERNFIKGRLRFFFAKLK